MNRKPLRSRSTLIAVAIATLSATATAFADDGSMSRLTGDSYAFFNNLDYSLGKFNTPRAPQGEGRDAVAKAPSKSGRDGESPMVSSTRPQAAKPAGSLRDDRGT
jgi:hypothetical protein